jgi:glyoxylase-like metal-dependent hydrolase (beta-lactamase superfamily II)
MSEPKARAGEVEELLPGLFHYSVDDERIKTRSDAFALVENGAVVLVDPLLLEPAALARLGRLKAIVIAAASHQRSAWRMRRETGAKVHAPAEAMGLDETPDATYRDGEMLPGGLRAVRAPGPSSAHYVLYLERSPGAVLCTDLVINDGGKGLEYLPDKYQENPASGRESARRLLELKFEVLGFGHGTPILKGGREALRTLVEGGTAPVKRGG